MKNSPEGNFKVGICFLLMVPLFFINAKATESTKTVKSTSKQLMTSDKLLTQQNKATLGQALLGSEKSNLSSRDVWAMSPSNSTKLTKENFNSLIGTEKWYLEKLNKPIETVLINNSKYLKLPISYKYIDDQAKVTSYEINAKMLSPLKYDSSIDKFKGILRLIARDEMAPFSTKEIKEPLILSLSGNLDEIKPSNLSLINTNLPGQEVVLMHKNPPKELTLDILPSNDESIEIAINSEKPKLTVQTSPKLEIDGLGFETAKFQVFSNEGSNYQGKEIFVVSELGIIDNTTLTLNSKGRAEATIRSNYLGTDTITVSGYPFIESSTSLKYTFPWTTVFALLVGLVFGVPMSKVSTKEKYTKSIPAGIFGAILAILGISFASNLIEVPGGELFICMVSGWAAFKGPTVFNSIKGLPGNEQ